MQIGSFLNGYDKQVLSNRAAESRRESQVATLKLPVAVRKVYVDRGVSSVLPDQGFYCSQFKNYFSRSRSVPIERVKSTMHKKKVNTCMFTCIGMLGFPPPTTKGSLGFVCSPITK